MTQYIDKDALVAEIERRRNEALMRQHNLEAIGQETIVNEMVANELSKIISLIDSCVVKEVDLEKELWSWRHNHFHGKRDREADGEYLERCSQIDLAKYFFELGIQQSITKEQMYASDILTEVKSFKPQPHWKPNVKQIKVLKTAIRHTLEGSIDRHELESLYNDLKKL